MKSAVEYINLALQAVSQSTMYMNLCFDAIPLK